MKLIDYEKLQPFLSEGMIREISGFVFDLSSFQVKDVLVGYNVNWNTASEMFKGFRLDPPRSVPIILLREDQKMESLSDEDLQKMGLRRI